MRLNDTINISPNLTNIEKLLLDFEHFPQTAILYGVLSELFLLSQNFRQFFQLKNINSLINELIIVVSAAIEREIILEVKDIDLLLRVTDLISNTCNINYDNISEISTITNEISNDYISLIRNLTKTIPLLKKTKYLKNELLKEYDANKISSQQSNENSEIIADKERKNKIGSLSVTHSSLNDNSEDKIIAELESAAKQIDWMDTYLTRLDKISKSIGDETSDNTNELFENVSVSINELQSILKNIVTLNNICNYDEYFRIIIKKIIQHIENIEDTIKKDNKIKILFIELKSLFEELQTKINDSLLNASIHTNSIYNKLSKISCKSFFSITLGLNDYINAVTESVNKNVKIEIIGSDIGIPINLCQIFNNALLMIIRHIILTNFDNNADNFIKVELTLQYGIIDLKIMDNGKKSDIKLTQKMLKDIFLMCKNAGGRIFLKSGSGANEIKIKFQIENVLENYVILEVNNQYYGIPAVYYVAPDENELKNINTICLYNLFAIKNTTNRGEADFIVINYSDKFVKILADKVVGIMMLSPQMPQEALSDTKYIIGFSNFADNPLFLLDIKAIIDSVKN